jgi:methionyl-tRNA formyltransferase
MLRVFLCGQSYFGQEVLRLLLGRADVSIVGVSAPVETLRGDPDRLWRLAGLHELPRQVAGSLRADSLPRDTDLLIAAHSHDFVGRKTRRALRVGAIGYHPSLLPLHRGRDAIRWAIRDRDRVTGGTVFWLNDTVDGGPIAARDWCFIRPGDTAESLWRRELQPTGLRLMGKTLDDIASGTLVRIPQDHRLATWEPSFDAPPLFRPELPELGCGGWAGYRVVVEA